MPSVEGFSFTSLVTNDPQKFHDTAHFYNKLGFRLSKYYSKASNGPGGDSQKLQLGVSHDSLRELWIESFPLQHMDDNGCAKPWQEHAFYSGDGTEAMNKSTIVKLRLLTLERVHDQPQSVVYFTTDLSKVKDILTKDLLLQPTTVEEGVLVKVSDPLGNTVQFLNRETPLSGPLYHRPEDYLEHRARELFAAVKLLKAALEKLEKAEQPKKKKIAIMTSGGDAPGMNPAVRAVVRAGIYYGCDVFGVYEGYEGLVRGGDLLKPLLWDDVRLFLSAGGTNIGTARCPAFRERLGRLKGAHNMVVNGIDALIVCGGDGSLTGADLFREEWPSLLDELVKTGRLTEEQTEPHRHLTIVGLVGSIDNDMSLTDATIGAFSSLERISEMVDYIDATAASHSRAFVVEVMGRHCGWLGLLLGLATGADFIFIPERPPKHGQWAEDLKNVCRRHRKQGKRNTTIIMAEGAIDDELNPIHADDVKKVLVDLGLDTRVTTLGHVQRGGSAVAYDRMLATLQGVEAIKAALESTPETPLPMIGILENKIVRQPLVEAVRLTKSVAEAIENKQFDKAMGLRDSLFEEAYGHYLLTAVYDDLSQVVPEKDRLNVGLVHVGASLAGLNAATRAAALYCLSKGHKLFAIQNGFSGLIHDGVVRELHWKDIDGWHNKGGLEIGTNRALPSENLGKVAYYLQKHNLHGLVIIGGFESFTALHELEANKEKYPIFNIPKVVIPATVSNNVPGTEYLLGSDTCLNQLVNYCDAVKQLASSSRRRVFVVEVQGGHLGFVALYAGLVTGALATYTPESTINLRTIQDDIELLHDVFQNDRGEDKNGKMIIRNEQASTVYTTELLADIIKEAAGGRFETRTAVPGHVQQGFTPSSMDRVNAIRFAVKSVQYIEEWNKRHVTHGHVTHNHVTPDFPASSGHALVVLGVQGAQVRFTDINLLYAEEADVALRKGKTVHWGALAEAADILSGKRMLQRKRDTA